MCAAALPFVVHDRSLYALLLRPPSSDVLYRLCWRSILHELHAPRLCTLQACLLLQQRLPSTDNPTNLYLHDTAFAWSLMSTAVSVAQTLGLHREPSSWITIPAWERRLRRRLWWTLWTTETWVALARGMPRLLGRADEDDQDTDVQPLGPLDMLAADTLSATTSGTAQSQPYLLHLVRLTTILAGIQRAYYTLRGSKRTSRHLARAMEVGRPLHARLQAWSEDLPEDLRFRSRSRSSSSRFTINSILASAQSSHHDNGSEGSVDHNVNQQSPPPPQHLDGNASLHLSYIVTHMMLFRALLRPLGLRSGQQGHQEHGNSPSSNSSSTADDNDNDALHHAVTRGALLCVREFVEFVEALTPTQWNAFWHGWSRASFSMAGSFIVYLLHVVTVRVAEEKGLVARPGFEDEYRELLAWIRRWRWASRVSVHGAAGAKGLTNLMLLRVETFLGELGELCEL
ncbi:hypothetical protein SBRCBS47491_004650 [Sporothrix bragantina]|uniref:Xylanolytic transcriptional activator regulatory domain-containing protein n=1 Tax=Sporothrix bragantina TaxID=671064 RepID=A0ABP0BQ64_9PEZI